MASEEGLQAGGSGSGRDKKRAPASPEPGANGGATATPKTPPAAAISKTPESIVQTPAGGAAASSPATSSARPAGSASAATGGPSAAESDDLVVVTLKASTGSIVSIEMTAADGSRHPLTDSETARLVGERPTFSSLVHDAFEAGLACVLDDRLEAAGEDADEAANETEEDVDLHDALLDALIERSAARRLLSRETVASAVLGTIIHAASSGEKPSAPPTA